MQKRNLLGDIVAKSLTISLLVLSWPAGFGAAATVDPLNNPSFEDVGVTPDQAFDWQQIGFGDGYARVSTTARTGTWSLKLTRADNIGYAGAFQRLDFQQTAPNPVFIGGYVKGDNIVNSVGGFFGAGLYLEIHLMNGATVYWNTIGSYGTFDWRRIGFNTGNMTPTGSLIDYIFVVPLLGLASGTAYFDDLTVSEQIPTQGAVTLMFDDGGATTYTEGKKQLDRYGYKGSAAVVSNWVNTPGYVTSAQLAAMQAAGWEIVGHTFNHEDMTLMTEAELEADLTGSKAALEAMGLVIKNHALPFGAYNANVMATAAKYYQSSRAFETGLNPQGTYPFEVKVQGMINSTTLNQVKTLLEQAKDQKRWLVLVFHDIARRGDDQYHTQPAQLSNMLKAVKASALPVVTYDQGLTAFGVAP